MIIHLYVGICRIKFAVIADQQNRRRYFGCRKDQLAQEAVRTIFRNVHKSAGSKPDRQRQRTCRQVPSSIGVPQNRTLRLWAKNYFDLWAAADSDVAGSLPLRSKTRGSWTYKTMLDFFKAKDLEFNKLSGENVVQLHIKTVKIYPGY